MLEDEIKTVIFNHWNEALYGDKPKIRTTKDDIRKRDTQNNLIVQVYLWKATETSAPLLSNLMSQKFILRVYYNSFHQDDYDVAIVEILRKYWEELPRQWVQKGPMTQSSFFFAQNGARRSGTIECLIERHETSDA